MCFLAEQLELLGEDEGNEALIAQAVSRTLLLPHHSSPPPPPLPPLSSPSSVSVHEQLCIDLLTSALARLLKVCGPLHYEVYSVRGKLMTTYLLIGFFFRVAASSPLFLFFLLRSGHVDNALEQCKWLVAYLCVALSHFPLHPLLGLQLFTLGQASVDS